MKTGLPFWGVFVALLIIAAYLMFWQTSILKGEIKESLFLPSFDYNKIGRDTTSLSEIKLLHEKTSEKIDAINRRIDDFRGFAGALMSLIIALNVAVYLKGQGDFKSYMEENFGKTKEKIEGILGDVQKNAEAVQTKLDMVNKLQNIDKDQQQTPLS